MKIKVIGSTKSGYCMPVEDALGFGGKSAGICYMPDSFESILGENIEKTEKRIQRTLKSGHHSVYDHPTYNLLLEDIPKILAMVLNNEGFYTTSEKSARYTKMNPGKREKDLYEKWADILKEKIHEIYPQISNSHTEKLARENSRYMISVFTPTTLEYTVSLRQMSYILGMMKKFVEKAEDTSFNTMLKESIGEFIESSKEFDIPYLNADIKGRELSLFDARKNRRDEFGENYSVNYLGSFAQLGQAQRHRTLDYKMKVIEENPEFYVPPIIRAENNNGDTALENTWLQDIKSVADMFPQGMLIKINERGTYENFILKAKERLCGSAQLEIAEQTKDILLAYILNTRGTNDEVREYLAQYVIKKYAANAGNVDGMECDGNTFAADIAENTHGYIAIPRCRFHDWKCTSPCIWGAKGLERLI
ncbi:MAG TPA: FAD-dependent thymidylate synthase [Clostridiales bacterium]|nr:FAD-dependent thymidylate synthase [Clostridiales bacterium]